MTLVGFFLADPVRERGGPLRPGRDDVPDGGAVRVERAAAREDLAGEPASGHRAARRRAAPHALVAGGLPQTQAPAAAHPARGPVAARLQRELALLGQPGLCPHVSLHGNIFLSSYSVPVPLRDCHLRT